VTRIVVGSAVMSAPFLAVVLSIVPAPLVIVGMLLMALLCIYLLATAPEGAEA
jgi:hypothetical protein